MEQEVVSGDIVILNVDASCSQWHMAKVKQLRKDSEGAV